MNEVTMGIAEKAVSRVYSKRALSLAGFYAYVQTNPDIQSLYVVGAVTAVSLIAFAFKGDNK